MVHYDLCPSHASLFSPRFPLPPNFPLFNHIREKSRSRLMAATRYEFVGEVPLDILCGEPRLGYYFRIRLVQTLAAIHQLAPLSIEGTARKLSYSICVLLPILRELLENEASVCVFVFCKRGVFCKHVNILSDCISLYFLLYPLHPTAGTT